MEYHREVYDQLQFVFRQDNNPKYTGTENPVS